MKYLESPIFYMGNKYKLLKQLIPLFPKECNTFLDLFGGSGVVSMNYKGRKKTIYNEFNDNIVELVKMFKNNPPEELDEYFTKQIEKYNIISTGKDFRNNLDAQKGYYDFREYYNKSENKDYRDLYLLICYSMNHLIRFNKKNEFNASCGSTQRYIKEKIVNMCELMKDVEIRHGNCFDIDFSTLTTGDFVYCDPPYLNTEAVPQNRNRCFMVSVLNPKCEIVFPEKTERKLVLKDMLENEVDEKYYLSDEKIEMISNWNCYEKPLENIMGDNSTCGTLTTRSGAECGGLKLVGEDFSDTTNIIPIKNDTKKGYLEATDGDGVDIGSRMKYHRGTVQQNSTQTITTSCDIGVVLEDRTVCEERKDEGIRFFKDNVCGTLRTIDSCGDKRIIEQEKWSDLD